MMSKAPLIDRSLSFLGCSTRAEIEIGMGMEMEIEMGMEMEIEMGMEV